MIDVNVRGVAWLFVKCLKMHRQAKGPPRCSMINHRDQNMYVKYLKMKQKGIYYGPKGRSPDATFCYTNGTSASIFLSEILLNSLGCPGMKIQSYG